MATYAERIRTKILNALAPEALEVIDESHRHAGHLQHDGGAGQEGETHFHVLVVSAAFNGQSRVARQRMVYDLLADELSERVHALSLTTQTPEERKSTR
jgi:BolA family transcriptional regulator, general stress-responsive regulator